MEAFLVVGEKLLVMGIIIFIGCIITKIGKFTEKTVSEMTWILLNVVTPCLIVSSFSKLESGSLSNHDFILGVIISLCSILVCALLSPFFFKKEKPSQQKVYRFAMSFSNASFMGLPLTEAILGSEGLVYASIYVAVFNLLFWTIGYSMMSGDKNLKAKNIFLNAGTLGFAAGAIVYAFNIKLPEFLSYPLNSIGDVNTPIAMFIFGYYLSSVKFKEIFVDKKILFVTFLRLFVMPSLIVIIMIFLKPNQTMFLSTTIQSCAPAATSTVLLAAMCGADVKLASKVVTATNLICLFSIPIFVSFVQILVNYL